MVKVDTDVNGVTIPCSIYLDGYEKKNLDYLNQRVLLNWDFVGIIVGGEGNGKSTYVVQRALYMSGSFSIVSVVFNETQFIEATENLPPGSAIVWDESDGAAEHWASTIVRSVVKRLKRCRKNNYKIFLVTPTFFDFNKYFALHRASFLVDVYSDGLERGFFRFFGADKMRLLYIYGKKEWNMRAVKPDFIGRFTNLPKLFPVDMSDGGEYDLKKDEAMKGIENDDVTPSRAVLNYRKSIIPRLQDEVVKKYGSKPFTQSELGRIFNISTSVINDNLKEINKDVKC